MNDGIFVSYSHKESKVVERIVDIIRETVENDIWFDYKLRGGDNFFSVIANQILKNKYFVFVVSANSVESEWCLRELEFAASEKRKIIAIWLDNIEIPPRVKLVIQNTHYINWYSATEENFLQAISLAFEDTDTQNINQSVARDRDDVLSKKHKYFLGRNDIKKLTDLLCAEANEKHSVCFEPENANLLGIAYESGVLVEPDHKKAALYYKASKYSGNIDGQYLYASLMFQMHSEDKCYLNDMIQAAEQGSVWAMTHVGDFYYEGKHGFPVDKNKAYKYYEQAAKADGITAMYYTAFGYCRGESLPMDLELAYMYALRAKEKGFPRAYRLLGLMYESGKYVDKNLNTAINFYNEAIKRGDYLSYCYQGDVYGDFGETDKEVELYKKAGDLADAGEIKTGVPYYRLAYIYRYGEGVEVDLETAVRYYFKAAERGHQGALEWTVSCILKIEGDKKIERLVKAYELNCKGAAHELGLIEKSKRSSTKERLSETAIKYFEAGAESGDCDCVLELLWDYSFVIGNGENREDRLNAIKWFSFLFANADEEFINLYRTKNFLATYYYAYAIELDYDPDINKPDREFVLYYFRKSIEESSRHLGQIISFSIDGYLFPKESNSGLTVDVTHAEEIMNFATENIEDYFEYTKSNSEDYLNEIGKVKNLLKKGYSFISKCYKNGQHVQKNKDKALKYSNLAKQF